MLTWRPSASADVPLLQRSFELWRELDGLVEAGGGVPGGPMECAEARVQPSDRVLNMTGGLMIGLPDSELITGTLTSAREHGLPHEVLSADEVHRRFPVFCPEPEEVGVFDPEAGYLVPEMCNYAHSRLGAQHGAELHYEEPITQWRVVNQDESDQADAVAGLVHLTTANGEYYARKLVLTVGAWAPSVYSDALGLGLHVQRRQLCWFKPKRDAEDEPLDSYKVCTSCLSDPHVIESVVSNNGFTTYYYRVFQFTYGKPTQGTISTGFPTRAAVRGARA